MYQDLKRTCTAIVMLVKPFLFPVAVVVCLLKLPNMAAATSCESSLGDKEHSVDL